MIETETANETIDEAAAGWYLRLGDAAPAERAAVQARFQQWIDADPAHADAFARVSATWDELSGLAVAPEIVTLRQAALADARVTARARWRRKPSLRALAAAAAVMILVGAGVWAGVFRPTDTYVTGTAERRTVALADNTQVDIDAQSTVNVDFSPERRVVHLKKGRAYFQVAKDPGRPFIVEAGGRQVVATGTAFDVEVTGEGMRVTLVEGQVVVRDKAEQSAPLVPGEQLVATAVQRKPSVKKADVNTTTSWRQGRLIFDNEPLADALAQVQRYSRVRIVMDDASLQNLRVSGIFNAGDVPAFVGALKNYFPVEVVDAGAGEIRLSHRD